MSHLLLKVFWAIWFQFLFLPGFPVYFFRFLSRFQRFVGQVVLLFPTLCRIWGSVGVVPFLAEAFKVTGNSMTRHESSHRGHHAAPTWAVEAGSCWASNHAGEAHTHLIWRPSRAVLGWMGAHPRGTLMSVRTLHAETSHALRIAGCEGSLLPRIGTLDGRNVLPTSPITRQKWMLPTAKKEKKSY